jgi:sugar phosphate isomerase/epimerase
MRVLHKFGGRLVISGSHGPRDVSGEEAKAAVKQFIDQMKPHVEAAEASGVVIGIENHGRALIATPDSLRYFAELTPSKHLGIALAPYHLPQDEELLAGLIKDLGPALVHFYAWQHGQGCMEKLPKEQELKQMPGRGVLDFKPLLAAMKKINYQGWTEIFMHPVPRGIPIMPTLDKVTAEINLARAYLERCLRELGG